MAKRLILILGDCLYENNEQLDIQKEDIILFAETKDLAKHFKYHKHKIILFFSAMRSHKDVLSKKFPQTKILYHIYDGKTYEDVLKEVLSQNTIDSVISYTIEDHFFDSFLQDFCKKNSLSLSFREKDGFLTSKKQFREWSGSKKKPLLGNFYVWQRKRLSLLVDSNNLPLEGQWSFDKDNRKRLPKGFIEKKILYPKKTKHTKDVSLLVDKQFKDHVGDVETFYLPTTREQALLWFDDFLQNRFKDFGPYEDAFDEKTLFVNHAVISPLLNIGLLTPKEVVDKAITFAFDKKNTIPFQSLEGFVRQIIGWREFIRGMYHTHTFNTNYFNHANRLTKEWYTGETGIPPFDDVVKKANRYAYAHHIERLMIAGNLMLLCEINPDDVYAWFMELFVDSADWVMVPNVYGMSQFADGGSFATKPYIAGSNYLKKMSHYKDDSWCDIVDGLYWRFIDKERELFLKNPRMNMMVSLFDNMDVEKKKRILLAAQQFIASKTVS